MALTIMAQR